MTTTTDHSKRGHAKISPSSLAKFESCPSYRHLERKVDLHPVTKEGTLLHEVLETGDFSKLDENQMNLVKFCIAYVKTTDTFGCEVEIEPEIDITPTIWGFVDRVQFNKDRTQADVLDWKFGWRKTEDAETNPQGQAYVLGLFLKYRSLKSITMHFVQPRLGYTTSFKYDVSHVQHIQDRVNGIITEAGRGNIQTPTEGLCEYCGHITCPAQTERAKGIMTKYTEKQIEGTIHPSEMTTENIARALSWVPDLENWCKSVRHHANVKALEGGEEIPGYDLRHRTSARKITDATKALEVSETFGISVEEFIEIVSVSMPKLESLVKAKSKRGEKGNNAALLEDRLDDADAIKLGQEISYLKRNDQEIK